MPQRKTPFITDEQSAANLQINNPEAYLQKSRENLGISEEYSDKQQAVLSSTPGGAESRKKIQEELDSINRVDSIIVVDDVAIRDSIAIWDSINNVVVEKGENNILKEIQNNYLEGISYFSGLAIPIVVIILYFIFDKKNQHQKEFNLDQKEYVPEDTSSKRRQLYQSTINKLKNLKESILKIYKSINLKSKLSYLGYAEIIVISLLIGTIIFSIFGYLLGEEQYFNEVGKRIHKSSYAIKQTKINYMSGIIGFLLSSCITFLYLKSINKNLK
ncbi:hypothetical protein [Empedobacter falsenii]